MLKKILEEKKCFKLVCGAGNEDVNEVEKLVALYSKAGCNFFDLCAKPEIIAAAKRGLNYSVAQENRENYHFCVSVGIKGDPHVSKAEINQIKCLKCGKCEIICPQNAIFYDKLNYFVENFKCIGCSKCEKACPSKSILMKSEDIDLAEILPPLVSTGISCVELHAMGEDDDETFEKWKTINNCFDGLLSICVDRSKLGNERLIKRVKKMIKDRDAFSTIIQTDGAPMSGGEDDFKTTLQAVATAEIYQNENLPVYILLSGGTNSKSSELAKLCGVEINGVAIGSFARKIVKEYLDREDFLSNKQVFNQALSIAKKLVDTTKIYT